MDRRKLLLAAAAIVAALGAVLVFLYVRGADIRAEAQYDTRDVLKVVTLIEQGETIEDAAAAGKIALEPVPANQVLPDALASTSTLTGRSPSPTSTRASRSSPASSAARPRARSCRSRRATWRSRSTSPTRPAWPAS